MCDKYSQALTDLAYTPNVEINDQVYWNLSSKTEKRQAFQIMARKVVIDKGDHKYYKKERNNCICISHKDKQWERYKVGNCG